MAIELTPTPEAVLVEGAVGCGKTTRLVERAAALLEGGAAPSDLLVLAATPDAARMLAARLEAACGAAVEATCVREVALGLLATEGGRAFSDRAGRLVTPVEMGFIMEDMKTCGLKNRRLKEMLKFFYRSWTELVEDADGNADWLLAGEEADVHGLLKGILDFTGGILEPELSALAVRYLLADGEALAGAQRAHVLVDDYQMLSRASQHVANLLARDSIAVAADPAAVVEVFDSYPYGEGVGEFTQANADCERIVLTESHACGAAAHAASRLREDAAPGAPEITGVGDAPATDSFTARESADPAAEVAAVAEAVEAALGAGCAPEDVYVLTFHPAWMRQVLRALAARDIAAAAPVEGRLSVGDYRDLDRCAAARLLTALALVANAHDALAWRAWCGFGDYLANSAVFADMRAEADEQGKDLVAMLDEVAAAAPEEGFPGTGIGRVLDAYRTGRTLIEQAQGLEGDELIGALASALNLTGENGEHAMQLVRALTAPEPKPVVSTSDTSSDANAPVPAPSNAVAPTSSETDTAAPSDAQTLIARARNRMSAPAFEAAEGCVLVGDSAHLTGRAPAMLVLAGFTNGFFPTRDFFDATVTTPDKQKLVRATDTRRLYAAAGKATQRLIASWFTSTSLVEAETLKLEIARAKLRRGERIAVTTPSIYLAEIDPAAEPSAPGLPGDSQAPGDAAAAPSS